MKIVMALGLAVLGFFAGGFTGKWIAGPHQSGFDGVATVALGALVGTVAGVAAGIVLMRKRR
jgi:hypothetical protein